MSGSTKIGLLVIAILLGITGIYFASANRDSAGNQLALDNSQQEPPGDGLSSPGDFSEAWLGGSDSAFDPDEIQSGSGFLDDLFDDSTNTTAQVIEGPVVPVRRDGDDSTLGDLTPVNLDSGAGDSEDGGKNGPIFQRDTAAAGDPGEELAEESLETSSATIPPTSDPTPDPLVYTNYTVLAGDTLWSIAEDWFGNGGKWDLIAQANPRVDPHQLPEGQVLRIPPKDATRANAGRAGASGGDATFHTVQSDDTLSDIAAARYGSAAKWVVIYEANRSIIGSDPGRLRVGMKLKIPDPSEDGA